MQLQGLPVQKTVRLAAAAVAPLLMSSQPPLLTFARKPGELLNYEMCQAEWSQGMTDQCRSDSK